MKKFLLLIGILIGSSFYGFAQEMDLQITADSTFINNTYSYSIKLSISGSQAPYNIEVYNKPDYKGGKLITSRMNCSESEVYFNDLAGTDQLYIRVVSIPKRKGIAKTFHL